MVEHPFSLEEQIVLVSGAGRGIGLAVAEAVAGAGASVALTARTESQVEGAAESIRERGGTARAFRSDVAAIEQHDALIDAVEGTCGQVTALVNVAGIDPWLTRSENIPPEEFDALMNVNQRGTFFLTQAVAKRWIAREAGGSIVTLSSVAGRFGLPRNTTYAMSRAAMEAMTKSLAAEWAVSRAAPIRVNCVSPGFVGTEMTGQLPRWYVQKTEQHTALRRWGGPEEVAGAVVYLLSDAARYVTGATIEVSGGYGLWSLDPAPPKEG